MLKKMILLLFSFCLINTITLAKKNKEERVPDAVKKEFAAKFPKAQNVEWELEKKGDFEAEFILDGKKMSADYDKSGKWLETEMKIDSKEIPDNIKNIIAKDYAGFSIKSADKAEKFNKGIVFELVIKSSTEKYELTFSQQGKLLEKEKKRKNKK